MIDPHNVTNYTRTDEELEEWMVFSVCVAGKTASTVAPAVHRLLYSHPRYAEYRTPILILDQMLNDGDDVVRTLLKQHGLGQFTRLTRCFRELTAACFDRPQFLRVAPLCDLMGIHGVGPKTARMFILHSREDAEVAALDTHILKWMKANTEEDVPDTTPPEGPKYHRLEEVFVAEAKKAGKTVADFDLEIWRTYARGGAR